MDSNGVVAAGQGTSAARKRDSNIDDLANQRRASQAELDDAIFGPEARVAGFIGYECTVAAVFRRDKFDTRILVDGGVVKGRDWDEGVIFGSEN